jgi:hypothetical protein
MFAKACPLKCTCPESNTIRNGIAALEAGAVRKRLPEKEDEPRTLPDMFKQHLSSFSSYTIPPGFAQRESKKKKIGLDGPVV